LTHSSCAALILSRHVQLRAISRINNPGDGAVVRLKVRLVLDGIGGLTGAAVSVEPGRVIPFFTA
jgi:hypothetical protein